MGHDADRGREALIRNIVYSKLSPFELSVTRSLIWSATTLPKRIARQTPWVVIPASTLYITWEWLKEANYQSHRKDPKEFENDV